MKQVVSSFFYNAKFYLHGNFIMFKPGEARIMGIHRPGAITANTVFDMKA
jgi:hypothetical protein